MKAFSQDRRAPTNVLCVEAGVPLVWVGGKGLLELRPDFFNAAWASSVGLGVDGAYAGAMMGGEPYAVWL